MNIKLFCIMLIVLISYDGLLASGLPVASQRVDNSNEIEVADNLTGNHYFQATKQIFYVNAPIQSPEPVPIVPAGYSITPGVGAHKFHLTPKSWNDARKTCIQEGAHLAVLRTANEAGIVKKLELSRDILQTWIGIHERFKNDDWVTVFDEPLSSVGFAPWNLNQPDHTNGNEHCITFDAYSSRFNDYDCSIALPFVCKIDLH